ncbi:MAG TPA: hypothetical protein VHF26_10135, partial [Trebonia sp.]|nr:hypothetical protein [Trebonia sp.]
CTPAFRVARVQPAGAPGDVFTTSALTWGHSILASVQYSDARRAFNEALTAYADAAAAALLADSAASHRPAPSRGQSPTGQSAVRRAGDGHPGGRWPVAEAGARLDAMKARIAEVTHPWQLVQTPAPDLGGQHLIGLHAMRHEVAEGADSVHDLVARLTGTRRHRSHPVA